MKYTKTVGRLSETFEGTICEIIELQNVLGESRKTHSAPEDDSERHVPIYEKEEIGGMHKTVSASCSCGGDGCLLFMLERG